MSNDLWTDWKQNKRIEAAEQDLADERRARSRLSEQMRTQQGNLQGQIDRLTTALVAMIEHEDIRAELGQYADAAACRRYAREVVSTVVVTGGAALRGSVEPADVPGYWLAAAARGVAATAQGEARGADLLTEARHRDPQLTTLFLSLLSAQTRDPRWVPDELARVLPDQAVVTTAQREVWLAIADGRLAPAGGQATAQLVTALTQQVAATQTTGVERVRSWLEAESGAMGSLLPAERAAAQLNALGRVLASGAQGRKAKPEIGVSSFLGVDRSDEPAPHPTAEDPLADCLRSLVDQGSPAEGDILDRMATARAELGFLDEATARMQAAWSASAGNVLDLLLIDLEQPVDSPRHAIARQALATTLATVAEALGAAAGQPVPPTRPVKVLGEIITVGTEGATSEWQDRVAVGVVKRDPINPVLLPLGIALLVAGVIFVGLSFVSSGFIVLAVAGILGGAGTLFAGLKERRDLADTQLATRRSTENDITLASQGIRDEQARSTAAASTAQEHLQAIRAALGARV